MKKILLVILLFAILLPSQILAADPFNLSSLSNTLATQIKDNIQPVVDMLNTTLNNGMFNIADSKLLTVGLQATLSPFPDAGYLTNIIDLPGQAIIPMLFVAFKVPQTGLGAYVRGAYVPKSFAGTDKDLSILGFGVGWEVTKILPIPLIHIAAYANYHTIKGIDDFEFSSLSFQAIGWLSLPLIKPFAEIGISYGSLKVNEPTIKAALTVLGQETITSTKIRTAIGAELFGFVNLSMTLSPDVTYTAAVRIGL